ncbi:hypothetical protein NECAME_02330 [Necator americanus]|uniref:SXP/RAL-2 family protein Ani s 5-like cation-binding domain-containing protein n=1 Tax=Necator americanus TaxID=51031 RepID=W2TFF8_NECAM|nr:hypothetical protein NECAME_02330 [Necator americanus]ETN80583.1 hypothetical protein NECAME_02330 [Necator americanus]
MTVKICIAVALLSFANAANNTGSYTSEEELDSNLNIPVGVMRKAQDAWAKKVGDPVWSAYLEHVTTQDAAKEAENNRMNEIVEKLSPAAQEADRAIRGIYSNETLTRKEINAEVSKKLKKLPKKVYNELILASQ